MDFLSQELALEWPWPFDWLINILGNLSDDWLHEPLVKYYIVVQQNGLRLWGGAVENVKQTMIYFCTFLLTMVQILKPHYWLEFGYVGMPVPHDTKSNKYIYDTKSNKFNLPWTYWFSQAKIPGTKDLLIFPKENTKN